MKASKHGGNSFLTAEPLRVARRWIQRKEKAMLKNIKAFEVIIARPACP